VRVLVSAIALGMPSRTKFRVFSWEAKTVECFITTAENLLSTGGIVTNLQRHDACDRLR
jgi:hypothetical protein